jgi:hypothetical protein
MEKGDKAPAAKKFLEDYEDYIDIMAGVEEAYKCSGGMCGQPSLPIYVFSNVNDGVPKVGCHKFL